MTRLGLFFDFRNPKQWAVEPKLFGEQQLALAELADDSGCDAIWVTEHHFAEDGYCPSPMTALGAIAGRTTSCELGTWVLLLGLHHPLEVATDACFLDYLSGGRLVLGVGAGYRRREFEGWGVDHAQLGTLMDEKLEILMRAVSGRGPITYAGKHFALREVDIRPRPVRHGGVPVFVGSTTKKADRRAIRLGANLAVRPGPDRAAAIRAACAEYGRDPADVKYGSFAYAFIADDVEEGWRQVGPHVRYGRSVVAKWFREMGIDIFQGDERDMVLVGPPEAVAGGLSARILKDPQAVLDHLVIHLQHPGMSYEVAAEQIERFQKEVVPLVKARLATAPERHLDHA